MLVDALLLTLHLLAATFWVGGMAVLHFAVRPAAASTLEPPQRLPLMAAVLGRFLNITGHAVGTLVAAGLVLVVLRGGWGAMHWSVHAMAALGMGMVGVYAWVRWHHFARLRHALEHGDWPAAGSALAAIRPLISLNLALGTLVYALALVGPAIR